MKPFIDLYSATGVLVDKKPYRLVKVLKLIKRGEAVWVTEGATAQLCRWTDAELEAERQHRIQRDRQDRSDEVVHLGEWRTVQYPPGIPLPSGFQLQHPRPSETRMLLEVSA